MSGGLYDEDGIDGPWERRMRTMDCDPKRFAADRRNRMTHEVVVTIRVPCRTEAIAEIVKRKFQRQYPDAAVGVRDRRKEVIA